MAELKNKNTYKIGDLVLATAGREEGKLFLVIGTEDNRVIIADGKSRKIGSAKRKNIKHIQFTGVRSEKLLNVDLTDVEIRKEISNLREVYYNG